MQQQQQAQEVRFKFISIASKFYPISLSHPLDVPENQPPNQRIWPCHLCQQDGLHFQTRLKLLNHKRSEHFNSVLVRSKVEADRRVLVEFHRNPQSKMFECRCGSLFRSTRNALYHRKCYETNIVPSAEAGADASLTSQGERIINIYSLFN